MDDCCLSGFGVTQEPKEQEENEYCDQHQQGDDSSYGRYYWDIEDNTQYAWASYLIQHLREENTMFDENKCKECLCDNCIYDYGLNCSSFSFLCKDRAYGACKSKANNNIVSESEYYIQGIQNLLRTSVEARISNVASRRIMFLQVFFSQKDSNRLG